MAETLGNGDNGNDVMRQAQWDADRATETRPLPGSSRSHYGDNGTLKQMDLNVVAENNVARAAGELGMTTTEWTELRRKLGRSPLRSDLQDLGR